MTPRAGTAAIVGLLAFAVGAAGAGAAEIRLIGATPVTAAVNELGARFERETGHRVVAKFVSGPTVKREIDAGQAFDVAISITPVIESLIKEGKIVAATRTAFAYAPVAVGVRKGAIKPDIGSVEAFKRALLNARSVAHSATGASGDHFKSTLARLGITDEMKDKLRPMPADRIAQAVPSGEAEMIVVTSSVIVMGGAELVGPIPAELQFYNSFAAGRGANSAQPEAALALLRLLTSSAAAPIIRENGMEPGAPQ